MARKAYIGKTVTQPIYKEDKLTTLELVRENFNILSQSWFPWSTQYQQFVSTNSGDDAYYDETYWDDETGEEYTDTYCHTAYLTLQARQTIPNFSFNWSVDSEEGYDYIRIEYYEPNTAYEEWVYTSGEQSGSIGPITIPKDACIYVYYEKDGSVDEGTDTVIISNLRALVPSGETVTFDAATPVKKIYIGVTDATHANVARNIYKAYIGDEYNKARPFFGEKKLVNINNDNNKVAPLSVARYRGCGTSTGNYAILASGSDVHNDLNVSTTAARVAVDAYSRELSHLTLSSIAKGGADMGAVYFSDCVLIGGPSVITRYNQELSQLGSLSTNGYTATEKCAANQNYSLWCTGTVYSNNNTTATYSMIAYNKDFSFQTLDSRYYACLAACGMARCGSHILQGGGTIMIGSTAYASNTVYAFAGDTLTREDTLPKDGLRSAAAAMTAVSSPKYAWFSGGVPAVSGQPVYTTTVYTDTLSRLNTAANLTGISVCESGTSVQSYVLIPTTLNGVTQRIEAYDEDTLNKTIQETMSPGYSCGLIANVGSYALYAGGYSSYDGTMTNHVRIYRAQ